MEKTFEQLIEDNFRNDSPLTQLKVLKLLQQVREATIAECLSIADSLFFERDGKYLTEMENLPTDRISTTEKEGR